MRSTFAMDPPGSIESDQQSAKSRKSRKRRGRRRARKPAGAALFESPPAPVALATPPDGLLLDNPLPEDPLLDDPPGQSEPQEPAALLEDDVEASRSQQMQLLLKPRGLAAAAAADQKAAVTTPPATAVLDEAPEPAYADEVSGRSTVLRPLLIAAAAAAILAISWRVGYLQGKNELLASASALPTAGESRAVGEAELPLSASLSPTAPAGEPLRAEAEVQPPPEESGLEIEPAAEPQLEPVEPVRVETPAALDAAAAVEASLYLQISASREEATAKALEKKLVGLGFAASTLASGDGLHRVVLGPFANRGAAQGPAQQLRSLGFETFPKTL